MNHWLIKSEASSYSIDDLKKDKRTLWTGIRNFQARNFMRDGMKKGDLALFYHSIGSANEAAGVYGIAKVTGEAVIDPTSLDAKDGHFDARMAKAKKEGKLVLRNPEDSKNVEGWVAVEVSFVEKLARPVELADIKRDPSLSTMLVVQPGQRLSVMPVAKHHFEKIVGTGK
jgi:predicted RNA-binding protein with PUA-like domain